MFCEQCGTENRNDRKFCTNCGAPLRDYRKPKDDLIMPEEIEQAQQAVKQRNYVKKFTGILMLIFFIFALALTIASFFVQDILFWVVIGFAVAFYIAMLITFIVRNKLLNKKSV